MKFENNRLVKALRVAFYPAFEPAEAKRFEAITSKARSLRNEGNLAGAEEVYLRAMAEAQASRDSSHLSFIRYGLAQVYEDQERYQEAERLFRDQLEEALEPPQPGTKAHGAHMGLARLFQKQNKHAEVEEHYRAALAEAEKPEVWPDREVYSSTAQCLARFYVEQHRYRDAEPLFQQVLEILEANRPSDPSLAYYFQELAKVYEAQEKYALAEELYRRAVKFSEALDEPKEFLIVRAVDELARFSQARGRYTEAEDLSRRRLAIVEEKIGRHYEALTNRLRRRPNDKNLEAMINHAQVPISEALERVAEICEAQGKYEEAVPLRQRSLEIREKAWGEANDRIWVDSLAAQANALHKIGRKDEAAKLDERVAAIRTKYPHRRAFARLTAMPVKRTLRGRFNMFINALLHPSPR